MKSSSIVSALSVLCILSTSCYEEVCTPEVSVPETVPFETPAEVFYSQLGRIVDAAFIGTTPSEAALSSTIGTKLAALPIVDGNGQKKSFFDLPASEQKAFFSQFGEMSAKDLNVKMTGSAALRDYVAEQNEMVSALLDEYAVETRAGETEITDVDGFFGALKAKAEAFVEEYAPVDEESAVTKAEPVENIQMIINTYAGKAKKGDFIVGLPNQKLDWLPIDESAKMYKKGHAELFCTDITRNTKPTDYVTIGTLLDGVKYRTINECWACQSNLLRLHIYDLKWERLRLRSVERDINRADIANYAAKYIGAPYVSTLELVYSKLVAPQRFTCVSLCWWTCKQLYGIEIGSWLLPTVLPIELYNSEYTERLSRIN